MLGDHEVAGGLGLDDGEADPVEVGDAPPLRHGVSARALGAAFVDVSRHHPGGQAVVVVRGPPELVQQGGQRERRVHAAAGDHHVGAPSQRLRDREGPQVDIRPRHPLADARQRLAGLHVAQLVAGGEQLVQPGHEVIAGHDPQPQAVAHPRARGRPRHLVGASSGIDPAGVGDHPDAALQARRQDALHQRHEVASVSGLRVAGALLVQDGHGHLGQVVHDQVVDRSLLDLAHRRIQVVAPKSAGARDAHRARATDSPHQTTPGGRWNAPRCGPGLLSAARSSSANAPRSSSGSTTSSTKPRAPAKRASSWRS